MKAGIRVSDTFRVVLGDTREEVLEGLDSSGIKYMLSFDKVHNKSKETIIQIPALGTEISLKNDIVIYMQSKVNDYNLLFDSYDMSSIDIIKKIKETMAAEFEFKKKTEFKIESINLKTLDTNMIINDHGSNIRVHIQRNNKHELYISTVKYE